MNDTAPLDAHPGDEPEAAPPSGFAGLGLTPSLLEGLDALGYDTPTPIQREAIPPLLSGRDLIGQAQTGTGKTAAFGLPFLQRLDLKDRHVQGLVLTPTRELAIQVTQAMRTYADAIGAVRLATVYGGQPVFTQQKRLAQGVHAVIGTPGRIMDLVRRGDLDLRSVRTLVLDEADEMLRMGFIEDVEWILDQTPDSRQTVLMSATMPPVIRQIAAKHLKDPETVTVAQATRTVAAVDERYILTLPDHKIEVLARILETEDIGGALVFCRTRAGCAELTDALSDRGFAVAALHGDLGQAQREEVVRRLRQGAIQLVVATDVAARGLDIDDLTHVINFDPPFETEAYVHRIGRTGRAGREGRALTLFIPRERRLKTTIERFTRRRMTPMAVPGNDALLNGRIDRLKDALVAALGEGDGAEASAADAQGDGGPYRQALKRAMDETGASWEALAVAAARLSAADKPLEATGPEPKQLREPAYERPPRAEAPPERRAPRSGPREMGQIFIPLGRSAGLKPSDLVGALANEGGIPGQAIGRIEIHGSVSFVELESSLVQEVLAALPSTTLRGRRVDLKEARPRPGGPTPPRPKGGSAFKGSRRPRESHKK